MVTCISFGPEILRRGKILGWQSGNTNLGENMTHPQSTPVGVIAAAGNGTRMFPVTRVLEKAMLPLGNYPSVHYVALELARSGVEDICIVVRSRDSVIPAYFDDHRVQEELSAESRNGRAINISHVYQDSLQGYGTAVPVIAASEFLDGRPFFFSSADDVLPDANPKWSVENLTSLSLLGTRMKGASAAGYGVVNAADGFLTSFEEKPQELHHGTVLVNTSRYFFDSGAAAVSAAKRLRPAANGELQITDLLMELREPSGGIQVIESASRHFDVGTPARYLAASASLLERGPRG